MTMPIAPPSPLPDVAAIDWTDPASILPALVSIPSINPMGRPVTSDEFLEVRLTRFLTAALAHIGLPFEVVEVVPGRSNIVAQLHTGHARTVLLDAHQDTVPVEGMTIPPFEPTIVGRRLYGRGSCDVKGGMAAMIAAVTRLHHAHNRGQTPPDLCNVVLSLTVDEEATSLGIDHFVGSWSQSPARYTLCPTTPDAAIVAEPTLLQAVVAHRGATRWRLRTRGRACHSSRPEDGVNAIYRMARVVTALEHYAQQLPTSRPAHPLCGPATLSVGRIVGGSSVNVVPDECAIDIDRRVLPGEDASNVISDVLQAIGAQCDFPVEADPPFLQSPPLSDSRNHPWADFLLATAAPLVGPQAKIGVAYGTHASRFDSAGVPAVVYGPGDIAQAHTKDEWIDLDQLAQATDIYERCCLGATTFFDR